MAQIPQSQTSGARIERVQVGGGRIPRVERLRDPVVDLLPPPVVEGIAPPIVDIPYVDLEYPTIQLPPAAPASPAPPSPVLPPPQPPARSQPKRGGVKERESPPKEEPALPSPPPIRVPVPRATPPSPEIAAPDRPTLAPEIEETEIVGQPAPFTLVELPEPQVVLQGMTTAVISTGVTLVTATVVRSLTKKAGQEIAKLKRNKFKVKIKSIKPVIHMVQNDDGSVSALEYTAEGVKTIGNHIQPEQFLRDRVEADELFEATHRIVIDEQIKGMFTKEGAQRFAYFAPAKKMAKRLAAKLTFG